MPRPTAPSLILSLLLAACGGDSSGPSGGGNAGLSVRIDGAQWQAQSTGLVVQATNSLGGLLIQGNSVTGGTATSVTLTLARITGPGSYPLGINILTNSGGIVTMTRGAQSFTTPLSGAAGTVSVTSISGGRIVGTFSFEAEPIAGTGSAVTGTGGQFNVAVPAGFTVAGPDDAGSVVSGSIGGSPWNGATIVASSSVGISFTAGNTSYMLSFIGQMPGPGTYPLSSGSPVRRFTVQAVPGGEGWAGAAADHGSITVTSLSDTRAVGTFTGTFPRVGATGAALTVNGSFNVRFD
jgi:hypothetical protein